MGGAVGQIVAGLALTAVTSFLQTRQAKANKKTRDALIRTRTDIQKKELARQAKMREAAYFQKRRLTLASYRNTMGSKDLDIETDPTYAAIQDATKTQSETFTSQLDKSTAYQLALSDVDARLGQAPEQLGITESIFGAGTSLAGNILVQKGIDEAE